MVRYLNNDNIDNAEVIALNAKAYSIFFQIENALRELIVDELTKEAGPSWHRHRLPGDVLSNYERSRSIEAKSRWVTLRPHHPIYYLDFPDLRKVIERTDNWRTAFSNHFPRKEILASVLAQLEPIRNAIAHNRILAAEALRLLVTSRDQLTAALGEKRFTSLYSRATLATDLPATFAALRQLADASHCAVLACQPAPDLSLWTYVSPAWWFEPAYLGRSIDGTRSYFATVSEYSAIPRLRGKGYVIERWVRESSVSALFRSCAAELSDLAQNGGA